MVSVVICLLFFYFIVPTEDAYCCLLMTVTVDSKSEIFFGFKILSTLERMKPNLHLL